MLTKRYRKGYNRDLDSYSAFVDSFEYEETGLDAYLKSRGVEQVYIVGVATDYCVFDTALTAGQRQYQTFIIEEACRGIGEMPASKLKRLQEARVSHISIHTSPELTRLKSRSDIDQSIKS